MRIVRIACVVIAIGVIGCVRSAEERKPATDSASTALFSGKDLSGWTFVSQEEGADPAKTWMVKEGVIQCAGKPIGYMRTIAPYENYRLRFEWRWPAGEGGNSGVMLHMQEPDKVWPKSIEGQLQHEHAGDLWVIDGSDFKEHTNPDDRRVPKKQPHNEKPLGEWNQYEIVCSGDSITLIVNGIEQNKATECNITKGFIGFQSEGVPIEFRNLRLEPLRPSTHAE